jgi:cytochrome P450
LDPLLLKEKAEKFRVNMHKVFSMIALDVIGQVAFSENLKNVENHLQDGSTATTEKSTQIQDITASVAKTVDLRMTYPRLIWNYMGLSGEFMRQKVKPIDTHLKSIIKARVDQGPKQESDTVDIIDRLCFLKDESGHPVFSDQEISEEVLSFFFAGHETTSNVLTSIMRRLCENPSVMNKLYEQVKDLPLTFEDIQACK